MRVTFGRLLWEIYRQKLWIMWSESLMLICRNNMSVKEISTVILFCSSGLEDYR